jgi:hypothetical protein
VKAQADSVKRAEVIEKVEWRKARGKEEDERRREVAERRVKEHVQGPQDVHGRAA